MTHQLPQVSEQVHGAEADKVPSATKALVKRLSSEQWRDIFIHSSSNALISPGDLAAVSKGLIENFRNQMERLLPANNQEIECREKGQLGLLAVLKNVLSDLQGIESKIDELQAECDYPGKTLPPEYSHRM